MNKSTDRKQRARAYRHAAELIAKKQQYACCHALKAVEYGDECIRMGRLFFDPFGRQKNGHWMAEKDELTGDPDTGEEDEALRHRRIVALCFMAAMVETGDA